MPLTQSLVDGLVVGALIALAAFGMTLVFGISRFINVAQGDFATLAAYLVLTAYAIIGLPFVVAVPVAAIATVGIVLASHFAVFRRLSSTTPVALLIASLGLSMVIRATVTLIWGQRFQSYGLPLSRAIDFGPFRLTPTDMLILGVAVAVAAAMFFILYRTRAGWEMRAVADLPDLARVTGINSSTVMRNVWVMNGILVSAAGILLGMKLAISPLVGWTVLLAAFAAAVVGGIGHPIGAIAGGLIIGVTTEMSALLLNPAYKMSVAFLVLAIFLLWRPKGLFGAR